MKVMFFIPTLSSGGAERVVSVLSNEMSDRGIDVTIALIINEVCVYKLSPLVKTLCLDSEGDIALPAVKRVLTRYRKIREAVKSNKPDVVISFMSNTNIDVSIALMGLDIPLIVSERNDPKIFPASKAKQLMRRFAYLKPKGFVFQTPDAQAYFSKRIQKKSEIILNPLSENLPSLFEGGRDKRIVAVGRLDPQKNYGLLLKSFKDFLESHSEHFLEIYGEGPQKKQVEEMISSLGLDDSVKLQGFCKDVHEKILTAGMFVMSSDFEGMPNALLEAMALGLPCISTDCPCGGPRMMIENKINGILVPVNDTNALTQAMMFVADNVEEAEKMGKKASEIREKTKVNSIVDRWMNYIFKIYEREK